MLSHERFEQRAGAARLVKTLLTKRLQRYGACHVDSDKFIDAEPQGKAFDVAVESTCKHQGGCERRAHRLMGFRRDQNGLHAYPRLPATRRLRPPAPQSATSKN